MLWVTALFLWISCSAALAANSSLCHQKMSFPSCFKFGAASAAYQIEGAWNVSDKGECKWDRLTHRYPDLFKNGDTGDTACMSYDYWQKDIDIIAETGMDFYRFSISWPRILPTGLANNISVDGVNYYNNLINGLLAKGIEPIVTLYHWEMPQMLEDLGGWANPAISDWFAAYARVVFRFFGDRVKTWLTINEPIMECDSYYGPNILKPPIDYYVGPYLCNKNILLAHAKAYRVYDQEFRKLYGNVGKISIANHLLWVMPLTEDLEDLAEIARQYFTGRYTHAIFSKEGGWPKVVEEQVAKVSLEQGFNVSRLPPFTEDEINLIRGSYDFFGMNHYTSRKVRYTKPGEEQSAALFESIYEFNATLVGDPSWKHGEAGFMLNYPQGIREQMEWVRKQYGDVEIMITENGYSTAGLMIDDDARVDYIRSYLSEVLLAIEEGINVTAYTYWSLMDNFEWTSGYSTKFGIYQVDFTDPERTRTPRKSARYYADIIKNRVLAALSAVWSIDLTFPPGFKFGAATASYQVEGGWNEDGKSESIWDRFVHDDPTRIVDLNNGDVACDSYHNWRRDIEMAEELGLHFYRISLSWPRILPSGFPNHVNEAGIAYYNNLINGLLEKGIEPLVTIYHWDLPQSLQDLGGWANPLIVDWFEGFSRVAFTHFGDRVKFWVTINEPLIVCDGVYNAETFAPAVKSPEVGAYLCNKYVMLAHAKAWRLYDKEFKPKYHGKVSIANQIIWYEPTSPEHEDLAELARQNMGGRYSHPIYSKEGGWPPTIEKVLEEVSLKRGYPRTQLPPFTPEEIELVKGTYDYFALNHYTSRLIRPAKEGEQFTTWPLGDAIDLNAIIERKPEWTQAASSWFFVNPEGLRKELVWLKQQYGDLEFMITENGLATRGGLDDQERVLYYRDYLEQILLAIKEDGVNVTAYTAWTLMDNFEWMDGYGVKFGLYEVNFTDPARTRTPRASAHYYANIIRAHSLDVPMIRNIV
ncbi:lactase/phlorizin hydrolase [Spodoptera frugiperda]|uniref:Lactase/phlorizin hydrolase n=1 Tax=Spodoptera frugiperda TaxID=7108 RepID=A0A9R0EXX1_SPOFR|nr:lactase/phlorizin hydrolase [Spodoptera frugiperda]